VEDPHRTGVSTAFFKKTSRRDLKGGSLDVQNRKGKRQDFHSERQRQWNLVDTERARASSRRYHKSPRVLVI